MVAQIGGQAEFAKMNVLQLNGQSAILKNGAKSALLIYQDKMKLILFILNRFFQRTWITDRQFDGVKFFPVVC